jgi:hypothetical protein
MSCFGGLVSRCVLLSCVFVVLSAGVARADEKATVVFPLSGALLKDPLMDAPDVLTRTLAREVSGTVAASPIEDQVGCDLHLDTCLKTTLRSAGAARIVFGTVTGRLRGGVILRLTYFDREGEQQKRFVLTGETTDTLSRELSHDLNPSITISATPPKKDPKGKEIGSLDPPIDQPEDHPAPGKVSSSTWGMIGGGGGAFVIGIGLVISAYGLKSDVNNAPTDTLDQLEHLQALERAGSLRMKIGGVLAVAGGAVATVGIIRMVMQRRKPPVLDVQPEAGGASLVLTLGWQ